MTTWTLGNGVQRNRAHPATFHIPSQPEKAALGLGDCVKLMFEDAQGGGERMWVRIVAIGPYNLAGTLANDPVWIADLEFGERIVFNRDNVIGIIAGNALRVCADVRNETVDRYNGVPT